MKQTILKSVMAVLVALFSLNVNAYDVEIDGIYYNIFSKLGTAEVTRGGISYHGNVVIPETIEYQDKIYTVTSISSLSFGNMTDLYSIRIPKSINNIGESAFHLRSHLKVYIEDLESWCNINFEKDTDTYYFGVCNSNPLREGGILYIGDEEVKDLIIPNNITVIKDCAFSGCSLASVTIPSSITSIGNYTFSSCKNMTSVIIPNSVTEIGNGAFQGCTGLESINVPNSVISIGGGAFQDCSGLTSVNIPDGVTSINAVVFSGCKKLTSVIIPNSVTKIGDGAFQGCIGLASVSIPNDVTSIGRVAFKGCTNLTKVILPPNIDTKILDEEYFMWTKYLNNIGDNAFVGCKNIEDVFCYSNQLPKMGDNVFGDAYVEYATLHVPASSIESYMADSQWGTFGTIVALTDEEMAAHIENITVLKDESHIYTIDGKPLETLQKGVNIIKHMSGKVKKVVVK